MNKKKTIKRCVAAVFTTAMGACLSTAQKTEARKAANSQACCGLESQSALTKKQAAKFASRAEALLGTGPTGKGEWGLLIADAKTGETLYQQNADRYFLPASNMKLFTTALALAKLGPDYRFRTTVESLAEPTADGKIPGPLYLVGRGDPNLSNRKFPFDLKEEFVGPSEKVIAELADAIAARGIKEISGDIVGDDSYFQRDRYPNGWDIDDMVWEYGAAISEIVLDDNTVQ